MQNRYKPIADYAIIGDCHTAALIARDGSVDWYCVPRFDSPSVFCRILDADKGGFFRVGSAERHDSSRSYVGRTNVLASTFRTAGGEFRLTDFMPIENQSANGQHSPQILRLIEGVSGTPEIEIEFLPAFDYARERANLQLCDGGVVAPSSKQTLALTCPVPLRIDSSGAGTARFRIHPGERVWIALTFGPEAKPSQFDEHRAEEDLQQTLRFGEGWASRCTYEGPYHELVRRSELALKLLTHAPTGALVAAPTTSLPEVIGGLGNWDYRYVWLRDSGLIVDTLQLAGYHDEASRYFEWLENLCLDCTDGLRIMYTLDGSIDLPEYTLDHFEGYRQSSPVRIGNGAVDQRQLDVYGHAIDAICLCHERLQHPVKPELWKILRDLLDTVVATWREPDRGPWEVRSQPRHFLYSKLFCWLALDRGLRIARSQREDPKKLRTWRTTRDSIQKIILSKGYDTDIGAFTYALGDRTLDASALVIPLINFLPPDDPRVQSTVQRIGQELTSNGLVYRNLTEDLRGEGTFTLCGFWLVENLALASQLDQAQQLFETITAHANDLGLLSEEIDPNTGELLGNFPQGYSHLGLMRSAVRIAEGISGTSQSRKELQTT